MSWFLNLSTRGKLFLSFGSMIVFMGAVIFAGYAGMTAARESQRSLYENEFQNAVDLKDIRANQNAERANLLTMMVLPPGSSLSILQQDIKDRTNENTGSIGRLLERTRNDPQMRTRVEEFNGLRAGFVRARESEILPLIQAGRIEQASGLVLGAQAQLNDRMRSIADELVDQAERNAQAALAASNERAATTTLIFAIVGLLAVLLGIAMTLVLNQVIATPLKGMSRAAERVAAADLTATVLSDHRTDEVGALAHSFQQMLGNLREVTREIREGVNVLGSSASEILAATTQVAASAAESATSVAQTTATVEEVRQTSQLASQKASYVSEAAQKSAQVAQGGTRAVEEAAEGMRRVQQQIESLAASILTLSEQSQAIGEIIATVNGLAEQSNLLAVNAAIEAAKAGEAGRGFGVVATEVKALAEQSKQATAGVRSILGDIQRATSAAVLATEQGSKAVEAGLKQSTEAAQSIRMLAESIEESAQAAIQIAATSQQQMVGMDQVALAIENINQASTQNAASTRQSETAAQNLHDLGQRLQELVAQYKV